MYPTIIKCPQCGNLFRLYKKPSKTFHCPKCEYSAPFKDVMKSSMSSTKVDTPSNSSDAAQQENPTRVVDFGEKTRVVDAGDKTKLVPGLQQPANKTGMFQVLFKGSGIGVVRLPQSGEFTLGRRSSDGGAKIKLAPDKTMSRIHAGMRTVRNNQGAIAYQITTIKPDNPVYVNSVMIRRGEIYLLKPGDKVQMGETTLIFKLG